MDNDIKSIIKEGVENIKNDVIHSMQSKNRVATGRTIEGMQVVETGDSIQLIAPENILALEFGRGPTRPDAPKGDPSLQQRIEEWVQAKGISANPFAITKKIHKDGYKGTPGVLSEPLSQDNVNTKLEEAAGKITSLFASQIQQAMADRLTSA